VPTPGARSHENRSEALAAAAVVFILDDEGGSNVKSEVAAVEGESAGRSKARWILIGLFVLHGLLVVTSLTHAFEATTAMLALLNLAAIAGMVTKSRAGWGFAAMFVVVAVGRYAMTGTFVDFSGLVLVVGIAAAVLCVTDPALRREHGITT
jgi:hypothetical protein